MTVKINDAKYKVLGMLAEISDDEFTRWSEKQLHAVQRSIIERVSSGPEKIKGFNKRITDLFNKASYVNNNVVCYVAVDDEEEIILYSLAKTSANSFDRHEYDTFGWDLDTLSHDDDRIENVEVLADVIDKANDLRRNFLQATGSRFETWNACQDLWVTCYIANEQISMAAQQMHDFIDQIMSFVLGETGSFKPKKDPIGEIEYWFYDGGTISIKNGYYTETYKVGPQYFDGIKTSWIYRANAVGLSGDAADLMNDILKSGVMASTEKFDYSEVYSQFPGYSKELTDLSKMQDDKTFNYGGDTDIIDGFVIADEVKNVDDSWAHASGYYSVAVLSRSIDEDTYSWKEIYDWGEVYDYLVRAGMKVEE
jgi:hypothetical protein